MVKTEKEGFLEAMAREHQEAALRLYWRKVAEGVFPENEDTVKAFAAGWYGTGDLKRAKQVVQNAGSGSAALVLIISAISTVFLIAFTMAYFTTGVSERSYHLAAVAATVLTVVPFLYRRARRQGNAAVADFRRDWAIERNVIDA